jgi:hypothetical protein
MRWLGRALGVSSTAVGLLGCAAPAAEPPSAPAPAAPGVPTSAVPTSPSAAPAPAAKARILADRQRPLTPSALLGELEKVGLKPGAYPRLEELSARQRLPVMEAFTKALGVTCTGCHVSDQDFAAETASKQLTRHMWNDFTAPLRLEGQQVFCDSCHQGSQEILYRADHDGVAAFMKQELSGRLSNAAGALACERCHGSPFEPHVFEKRWGVKG